MDYISVPEARHLPGLRLVLSAGVPGPWGEAAKSVLIVRNIPFVPVAQSPLKSNDELVAWTGIRNAPIAVYNDDAPAAGWLEILHLAERIGSGPSLIPEDYHDRALALGLTTEIASFWGLGWSRRLQMFADLSPEMIEKAFGSVTTEVQASLVRDYQITPQTMAAAPARIAEIFRGLTQQLRRQRAAGSPYFVGDRLSVCDIYSACFLMLAVPLPHEVNPMPDALRAIYGSISGVAAEAISHELLAHREFIYEHHLRLPLDY